MFQCDSGDKPGHAGNRQDTVTARESLRTGMARMIVLVETQEGDAGKASDEGESEGELNTGIALKHPSRPHRSSTWPLQRP